jgi:hypothetical protein
MSYTILKTDGTALTSVVDGTIDQTTTDLTLIGKNSSGYGVYINDNFIRLLENFASISLPNNPIQGQLWYDTGENRLKVYNGTQFVVSGGTIISSVTPSGLAAGDLWIDNVREQLFFNDGLTTLLAGPIYSSQQGLSGFNVETILDVNNISRTVVYLFVAQTLLGIFSKVSFVPLLPIAGMPSTLKVGFTSSTLTNFTLDALASRATALVSAQGDLKTAENFVSTTDSSQSLGTLSIQNSTPLVLGTNASTELNVSTSLFQIKSNIANQNFQIQTLTSGGARYPLYINASATRVGINTQSPESTLDVNGDVTVQGNLTVKGSTLTINSTTLSVVDKNIELGKVSVPTDVLADGGGITLKGSTDKTFNWIDSTDAWTSSEHINLASTKTYKINNFDVITSSALGSGITSAPGLTSIGTLTSLQVTNIGLATNTISYVNPTSSNGNIVLSPKGTGSVDVDTSTIINVSTPVNATDAANKTYVDTTVQSASLAITISQSVSGLTNPQIASTYLSKVFPAGEHQANTLCRVICSDNSIRQFQLLAGIWTYQMSL